MLSQTLLERRNKLRSSSRSPRMQNAYSGGLRRLLRPGDERRGEHDSQTSHEGAPVHSIT
jgi:hypothetical protein